MKFLGVDFGTKRVGVAISDEGGSIAFPFKVLKNDRDFFDTFLSMVKEENIERVIVGESLDSSGAPNKVNVLIKEFIEKLKEQNISVETQKEFFSSFEAHDRQGKESLNARKTTFSKTEELDSKAASVILQRYLEKINLNKNI